MSDGPFVCYKELLPTAGIVSSCFFRSYNLHINRSENYLCTISSQVLSIYRVVSHASQTSTRVHYSSSNGKSLELVRFTTVFGKLREVKALQRGRSKSDVLVVAIDEGKFVLFEYNATSNEIIERPLCNLEENAVGLATEVRIASSGRNHHLGNGVEPVLKSISSA